MSVSAPFCLTLEDVQRAELKLSDVGYWCVQVEGCYHLFDSERAANRAYKMMLEGQFVR